MTDKTYTQAEVDAILFNVSQAAARAAAEYQEPSADEIANEFMFGYNRADDIKICVLTATHYAMQDSFADIEHAAFPECKSDPQA